jgi:hypothetical protein
MNVEIGTEAVQFLFWEYLFRIFGIVYLQCTRLRAVPLQRCCQKNYNMHIAKFLLENLFAILILTCFQVSYGPSN